MRFPVTPTPPKFCSSEPPPRLPFSDSGVILQSTASACVAVGGGRVYLTTAYRGGPFGLSVVVPAVAGLTCAAVTAAVRPSAAAASP